MRLRVERIKRWNGTYCSSSTTLASSPDGQYADLQYRRRLSTLLSVDDMVRRLVDTLTRAGRLNSTFIFYSSDNGACVRGYSGLHAFALHTAVDCLTLV